MEERRAEGGDFTTVRNGENRTGGGYSHGGDAVPTVEREGEGGSEGEGVEMERKGEFQQERRREGKELRLGEESGEDGGGRGVAGAKEGKEVGEEVGVAVEERGRGGRRGDGERGERGGGARDREGLWSGLEQSASYVERYYGVV